MRAIEPDLKFTDDELSTPKVEIKENDDKPVFADKEAQLAPERPANKVSDGPVRVPLFTTENELTNDQELPESPITKGQRKNFKGAVGTAQKIKGNNEFWKRTAAVGLGLVAYTAVNTVTFGTTALVAGIIVAYGAKKSMNLIGKASDKLPNITPKLFTKRALRNQENEQGNKPKSPKM
jgi:hypothetical protein